MRLKPFTIVFAFSLIAVAAGLWFGSTKPVQATNYQPFTATLVDINFEDGTDQFETNQIVYARKSDGSSAEIIYMNDPNGRSVKMINLVDVPRSRQVTADGLTQSTTTYNHSWNFISDQCTEDPGSASDTLHGFKTVRMLDLLTIPGGMTIRAEVDEAPALGCYALRKKVYISEDSASFTLAQSTEVTALTLGEPNSDLFVLPAGYVERKPTDVYREFGRRFPDHAKSEAELNNLRHLDRRQEESAFTR